MDHGGPLTRSIASASTSGMIDPDAAHWSIEPFIPITVQALLDHLCSRATSTAELSPADVDLFRQFAARLESLIHNRTQSNHQQFSNHYSEIDPDSDCRIPGELITTVPDAASSAEATGQRDSTKSDFDEVASTEQDERQRANAKALMELCDKILISGGYRKLGQDELEKCVGVASQWGVPLKVDFSLFRHLAVYARGDIIGKRFRRRLRSLYRPELVDVAIYQRVVVLFQVDETLDLGEQLSDTELHLRMFKNIPKQDVDMLLPGGKVLLSKLDQAKIIVPSLGGWLLSLQKIGRFVLMFVALTMYTTAFVFALAIAAVGYLVKSVFSYFQTRNRYLLDLTRNLYFQKLDTNAGAAYRIIQQAHRQSTVEAMLAYYAVVTESKPISTRRLRRKCERLVREAIRVEIDFQVDRTLETLRELGAIELAGDGERWIKSAEMIPVDNI
ncbi:hypothetical protein Pla52n_44770 [Stieleria varia]|uniref:DUF3754 domain-containing protein n=2 Tax=Stieleria varia TaxID=2528005 RepID=A0A5C6AM67_9BACT|nr:hypothetical protein Pla52n_44770 [Stieleria varia]